MYGLSSAWLNDAERRRLDGFQARCLRMILGIKPSFISRVSNKAVLEKARQPSYTTQLSQAQLLLFGKIAASPQCDPLRQVTFQPNCLQPATSRYVRRVGRPRHEWCEDLGSWRAPGRRLARLRRTNATP